jgi:hypothetical protein
MIQTRVDAAKSRVYTNAVGRISFGELLGHVKEEIRADAHRYKELFDASSARTDMTESEVRQLATLAKDFRPASGPGAIAIVVSDPSWFRLAELYQLLCENHRVVGVFREITAAAKWLKAQHPGKAV